MSIIETFIPRSWRFPFPKRNSVSASHWGLYAAEIENRLRAYEGADAIEREEAVIAKSEMHR